MEPTQYIINKFDRLGIPLEQRQAEQFYRYFELLVEWNSFMNLTAITKFEDVVEKHFIDSTVLLAAENVSRETSREKVIDVGTGAGFPGIPLKILCPGWQVTLLDSLNKRVNFLNTVITDLGLDGIEAVHGRAEEVAQMPQYREAYSICVSRAVANLSTLSEYCLPFLKVGGHFVSYKAGEAGEEIENAKRAIGILGGKISEVKNFALPDTDIQRIFAMIDKIKPTPKKYPRKAGTPNRQPL